MYVLPGLYLHGLRTCQPHFLLVKVISAGEMAGWGCIVQKRRVRTSGV
jgi:hypothetical protein